MHGLTTATGSLPQSEGNSSATATLLNLLSLSEDELSRYDIAVVNMACAVGLRGAEALDIPSCLATLDRWASIETIPIQTTSASPLYQIAKLKDPTVTGDSLLLVLDAPGQSQWKDAKMTEILVWEKHFDRTVKIIDGKGNAEAKTVHVNLMFGVHGWEAITDGGATF